MVDENGSANEKAVVSPTKVSPSKKEIDVATQALNHFAQGKRHLLVHDISSAVNSLQEASRILAEQYGETASECGDAYFYYGRALLEMARIENGVLGDALDSEESAEEGENDADNDESDEGKEESQDEEKNGEEKNEDSGGGDEKEEKEEEGEKTEEDEDISNLELAWEMFELAKLIFHRQEDKNPAMPLKLAQVYLKLGEVGLENENYQQSIDDFTQCLLIQKKYMEPDNRYLAETHYQLGVAHSFSDEYDKAIDCFQKAIDVINAKITNLQNKVEEKKTWTDEQKHKDVTEKEDPFYTEEAEIEELGKLLPEIEEKVSDMEQVKKDSKEKIQLAAKAMAKSFNIGSCGFAAAENISLPSSSTTSVDLKPVSDISHLVHKKRKPDEHNITSEAKKLKYINGDKIAAVSGQNKTTDDSHCKLDEAESGSAGSLEKVNSHAKMVSDAIEKTEVQSITISHL